MKKRMLRLLILVLCVSLLAGCAPGGQENAAFRDMAYTRPDMQALESALETAQQSAEDGEMIGVIRGINQVYRLYDSFFTNYNLADIHYCANMADLYWQKEYSFCAGEEHNVDGILDRLYRSLANSSLRETLEDEQYFGRDFFDDYEADSGWDAGFLALMEEEGTLQQRYYDLTEQTGSQEDYDAWALELAEILAELIRVRQEIADYWGYPDYVTFAGEYYHGRSYTPDQALAYTEQIRLELTELYRRVNGEKIEISCTRAADSQAVLAYVRQASQAMGGTAEQAFLALEQRGLYDIGPGENKYPASFELYLLDYDAPFIFMDPEGTNYDMLTLAHEFGHFCCDYAAQGSYAGTDVSEFFSQGMEYLSLLYAEGSEELTRLKLADSLYTYVEQAAFARFEMDMYALPEEQRNGAGLAALYEETAKAYGLDSVGYDPMEFVEISHYYTQPMYIISYVVSNDAAMQLYQLEQEQPGKGLACFEKNLTTQETDLLTFLAQAGLESPFAPGRLSRVRETLEGALLGG